MRNRITFFTLCGYLLALTANNNVRAEEPAFPFVIRTFAFFPQNDELEPDYFDGENSNSLAVTVMPTGARSDLNFADCEQNGSLAGKEFITSEVNHATIGNQNGIGTYAFLSDDETPLPPPVGATAITGSHRSLVLSQEVYNWRTWHASLGCPGNPGDGPNLLNAPHSLLTPCAFHKDPPPPKGGSLSCMETCLE